MPMQVLLLYLFVCRIYILDSYRTYFWTVCWICWFCYSSWKFWDFISYSCWFIILGQTCFSWQRHHTCCMPCGDQFFQLVCRLEGWVTPCTATFGFLPVALSDFPLYWQPWCCRLLPERILPCLSSEWINCYPADLVCSGCWLQL